MNELPIIIRPATNDDLPIIVAPWMTSFKKPKWIDWQVFNEFQRRKIYWLLNCMITLVACDVEDSDHVLGWICGGFWPYDDEKQAAVIHYMFVKGPFRKRGIGERLLKEFEPRDKLFYTHETVAGREKAIKLGAIYNPYLSEGSA